MEPQAYIKVHIKDTGAAPPIEYINFGNYSRDFGGQAGLDTMVCCDIIYGNKDIESKFGGYHHDGFQGTILDFESTKKINVPEFQTQTLYLFY
jgi:hypothetical protein